jgi:hypothetical protein
MSKSEAPQCLTLMRGKGVLLPLGCCCGLQFVGYRNDLAIPAEDARATFEGGGKAARRGGDARPWRKMMIFRPLESAAAATAAIGRRQTMYWRAVFNQLGSA